MSQWAELRHQHFVDGVSKKALARRFDLDVKTVRRALESKEPPQRSTVARPRLLDPFREEIEALLGEDPKITAKRIGRLLEPKAGRVNPRTLRKYVASLRGGLFKKEAFVHRTHRPGHTIEGDFGESWAIVAGELRKVKFFVATLPCSNAYFAKAYPVERLECLLDGMAESFAFFGGVSERYVLDNASMVVKKILRGRDREVTQAFEGFRGQYPFGAEFCAPAKGNEKGSVETGVKYVRNNCFRPMPNVSSFEEFNALILRELRHDMDLRTLPGGRTVRLAWQAEREHLRPLPIHRPETCRQVSRVGTATASRTRSSRSRTCIAGQARATLPARRLTRRCPFRVRRDARTSSRLRWRCWPACLPDGDAKAAEAALAETGETGDTPRLRLLLHEATGDRVHLEEAKRLLDEALSKVPEDYHIAMLTNVRVNREIMQAWNEQAAS